MATRDFFWVGVAFALALSGCSSSSNGDAEADITVTDVASFASLTLAKGQALRIVDGDDDGAVQVSITESFVCGGAIELSDGVTEVDFVVSDALDLNCVITSDSSDDSPAVVRFVTDATFTLRDDFQPYISGAVIVVDDSAQLLLPEQYAADATVDDGQSPVLMAPPVEDELALPLKARTVAGNHFVQSKARDCDTTNVNRITGQWAGPEVSQNFDGSLVVAIWATCDVEIEDFQNDPPVWLPLEINEQIATDPDDAKDVQGSNGKKGMTLNVRSQGKVTFKGNSILRLMDGAPGQDAIAVGRDAMAVGGRGGDAGNLKISAGQSIDIANGTLLIVPGDGGPGGNASANGLDGQSQCDPTTGANAVATGGRGGDAVKVLRARGVAGLANVTIGDYQGGAGGSATATGGTGGDNCDGAQRHGADGGDATATGGAGGDASFAATGFNGASPEVTGGDGGEASASGGNGGAGGDEPSCPVPVAGNGGVGGDAVSNGGVPGTGTDNDGSAGEGASAAGVGGQCGDFPAVDGSSGDASATNGDGTAGAVAPGLPPGTCDCPVVTPSPSPTPTATPIVDPTPTPTATPTANPSPSATPTPSPTATPAPFDAFIGSYTCGNGCGNDVSTIQIAADDQNSGPSVTSVGSNGTLSTSQIDSTTAQSNSNNVTLFGQGGHFLRLQFGGTGAGRSIALHGELANDSNTFCDTTCVVDN